MAAGAGLEYAAQATNAGRGLAMEFIWAASCSGQASCVQPRRRQRARCGGRCVASSVPSPLYSSRQRASVAFQFSKHVSSICVLLTQLGLQRDCLPVSDDAGVAASKSSIELYDFCLRPSHASRYEGTVLHCAQLPLNSGFKIYICSEMRRLLGGGASRLGRPHQRVGGHRQHDALPSPSRCTRCCSPG